MTTEPTALLRRTEAYLSALHGSVARHDNLAANLACAGCELRDEIRAALAAEAPATTKPETDFLVRVLELFSLSHADSYGDLMWHVEDGNVHLSANVSDVFAWGGADCEPITPDTLAALEQAYADLKDIRSEEFTADLYAARQRGERPQGAAYPGDTHPSWRDVSALFDACGPERPLGLGNPKAAPAHRAAEVRQDGAQPCELLALATVLEIPRPHPALPIQLRRAHGHTDRWAICDGVVGRRWHREHGWVYEQQSVRDEEQRDATRYTLAEAVPLARKLAMRVQP